MGDNINSHEPENGRREYADREFINALQEGNRTNQEIANELGCTRQAVDYRMRKLRESGNVKGEKIGNTMVWSLSE